MGARRGQEYIEGLRDGRRIYVKGELVRDVTSYPPVPGRNTDAGRLVRPSARPRLSGLADLPFAGLCRSGQYFIHTGEDLERNAAASARRAHAMRADLGPDGALA